jgi:hypothetical protein
LVHDQVLQVLSVKDLREEFGPEGFNLISYKLSKRSLEFNQILFNDKALS